MARGSLGIFLLLALAFGSFGQRTGTPGVFDYYVLNLSWSPEYCYSNSSNVECTAGHHFGFIVHGLWPEFQNGSYPENCSNAAGLSNPGSMLDIMPDPGLIRHEWETHGTCSGLSAQAYFDLVRKAFTSISIPPDFTNPTHPLTLSPTQLKADFEQANPKLQDGDLMISCSRGYLKAIEVCLTKSLAPMACPAARSCTSRTIRVPPVR